MDEQPNPLPLTYWNAFDDPVADADCESISGSPPVIEAGQLSAAERSMFHFNVGVPPARVECALHTQRLDGRSGLLVRVVDDQNHYLVQINLADQTFELHERNGSGSRLVVSVPLPLPIDILDFHAYVTVDDTGSDLICRLHDLDLCIKASQSASFENLYKDADRVGLTGIGEQDTTCRLLRAWSEIPEWDGIENVEPAWGAQHIWTKIHQRHVGKHDRSYWGWSTIWGTVQLRWYDHSEKRFGPIETVYRYPGRVRWAYDDHHPPGICIHGDGRVWVWIQSHKSAEPFFLLRSEHPEDISSWQDPVDMNAFPGAPDGGVYPRAYRLENGEALLFHRTGGSGDGEWYIRRSEDDGQTWDSRKIIDNSEGHVYQFVRQDPENRDRLVMVGNHKDTSTRPNSWRRVYVWETPDGGRTFQTVTDKRPIDLPAKRTDLEPVYTDAAHQLFVTGQAIRPDGTPLILAAHKDDPDHVTVCLSWQKNRWQMTTIAANTTWPGSASYKEAVWRPSGGDVDPRNTDEITLSVAVDGVHEIQRWETSDGGLSWRKVADITTRSRVKNFRPTYIENAHEDDWRLLWHSGEFYGTTEVPGGGRHFDRFDDVMIVNELLVNTIKK